MQGSCSSGDLRCLFWAPLKDVEISHLQCYLEEYQCRMLEVSFNAIPTHTQSCTAYPYRLTELSLSPTAPQTTEMLTPGYCWKLQASEETLLQPQYSC